MHASADITDKGKTNPLEVPFFLVRKWPLLPKVPIFETKISYISDVGWFKSDNITQWVGRVMGMRVYWIRVGLF